MSPPEHVLVVVPTSNPGARQRAEPSIVLHSLVLVAGLWWLATGLLLVMERDTTTRGLGLVVASAFAGVGVLRMLVCRHDASAAAARASFTGGALVWIWIQCAFYGGWIVGSGHPASEAGGPGLRLALEAISATAASDALAVAALGAGWLLVRRASNRSGFWSLLTFFGLHQLAKLNVFLGVANPLPDLLPEHLAFLRSYFGPSHNSPLLPLSIVGLTLIALWLVVRSRGHELPGRRQTALLAGMLVALGAVEHVALSGVVHLGLWAPFLRLRGD